MAPATLKKLIAAQSSRSSEITSICDRLRARPRDSLNASIVVARVKELEKIWMETRETHVEIIGRDDAAVSLYVTDKAFEQLQVVYEDALDESLRLLDGLRGSSTPAAGEGNNADLGSRLAKLPRLSLPTFSGRYEDWESFCDLFASLVDKAPHMADATKLQYLKSCLTGSAAELVKDVPTTNANYLTTWKALQARFDNPRLIVSNHLNALMNISQLKSESAVELRAFADESQRIVRALANLKMPVNQWDIWFIHLLVVKLDSESRKAWETELSARDRTVSVCAGASVSDPLAKFPKFTQFAEFLEKRAQTLSMLCVETKGNKKDENKITTSKLGSGPRKAHHIQQASGTSSRKCPLCERAHPLYQCFKFKNKSPYERRADVRRLKLCFNCFGLHKIVDCNVKGRCHTCNEKHHSLLHFESKRSPVPTKTEPGSAAGSETDQGKAPPSNVNVLTAQLTAPQSTVIFATAQLMLFGPYDNQTRVRVLLDQGAETSFVSQAVVQLLGLKKYPVQSVISGLNNSSSGTASYATQLRLRSLVDSSFEFQVEALIMPQLTSKLPRRTVMEIDLTEFHELVLADPAFYVKDRIDIILGADVYGRLLTAGLKTFSNSSLVAQNTALGWVVSGPVDSDRSRRAESDLSKSVRVFHSITDVKLNESIERFWKIEEMPDMTPKLKPEEEICEKQFDETHTRDSTGRYVVRLPLKENIPQVGPETKNIALSSLNRLHSRFTRDPKLAQAYRDFMTTYEELGHMTRVPISELDNHSAWYLPHHPVVTSTSQSWKIRVVFDASRQCRDRHSLNDFLLPGPALQRDLSLILLNWRRYKYVFTADIVKMFRQIRVALEDQDVQRIIWSPCASENPLARDQRSRFPLGAQCLEENTYVDDAFAGADRLSEAKNIRDQLVEILGTAGMELDKWAANHRELLTESQSVQGVDDDDSTKYLQGPDSVKTLGIQWNPIQDKFKFNVVDHKKFIEASTKRSMLANISRLFDPLGWVAPVTIVAKILMQDLWILKCDWDEPLPAAIREQWLKYSRALDSLPELSIDRWLGTLSGQGFELHGFSDASARAYGAVVYIRVKNGEGYQTELLAAKTKVAPVKTLSIPNLELCGAVLLTKLIKHIQQVDFLRGAPIYTWTDSQIVLRWLRKHPRSWKTFVANRVSFIQTELPTARWAHVSSRENPADLASRGAEPSELKGSGLWWRGPTWLSASAENWPPQPNNLMVLHSVAPPAEPELLRRYSSLGKLLRIVAYCRRPLLRLRARKNGNRALPPFLTLPELSVAKNIVIKMAQSHAFSSEIALLSAGKELPKRHTLRKLAPYVDVETGMLCMRGRLTNSNLSDVSKHPPILPRRSNLSRLFIRQAHRICLHGGPTLTLCTLSQSVWILGRINLVKTHLRNCVICQRHKPHLTHQLMGDLPAGRVTPSGRPFATSGLDYAGPIQVRTTEGRGYRSYKGYIALFVCFATRAVHLEVVSKLTTKSFVAAYRRFIGRRGVCENLYSDNATTFHGADKELQKMFRDASKFYIEAAAELASDGTNWTFIPPNAPHYGGLWEAGVKSVKHHLKRVIGEHTLTFEELSTVLVEIEACLNSRPLCPKTSNIDDLSVLTPASFLIGESSMLIPEAAPPSGPENLLNRFQLLQRIRNNFWNRWSLEYLQHLQERTKWKTATENFAIGQLVLIKDDRYPPSKWHRGRIIDVHPGSDGLVRVVSVKTSTNILRRHVARLCPLSLGEETTP